MGKEGEGRGGRGKEGKEIEGGWLDYSTQLIFNDNEYFHIVILTVHACSHSGIMVKQELSVTPAASVTAQSRLHYSSATDTGMFSN